MSGMKAHNAIVMNSVKIQTIFMHVTAACNLQCKYCYFPGTHQISGEMTRADFRRLWPEVLVTAPTKLVITGGEPLLRADLLDLIRDFRYVDPHHQVLLCLNSNGYFVTAELAASLVGLVDEVRVSLDALAPCNDLMRGKGNFDMAMKAINLYRACGFDPKVLVTVTRASLPDLEDLVYLLINQGIFSININRFRSVGRGANHPEFSVSDAEIQHALTNLRSRLRPNEIITPIPQVTGMQCHCGIGRFLNIIPNGDVFPCHVLMQPEFRIGNVREQPLGVICRPDGVLGQLAALDFRVMSQADAACANLTQPGVCLGEVYTRSASNHVWGRFLPTSPNPPSPP